MSIYAVVSQISPTRLWGLDSAQRLARQLAEIARQTGGSSVPGSTIPGNAVQWLKNAADAPADAPPDSQILVINGHYLFESRTLSGVLTRPDSLLVDKSASDTNRPAVAAALVNAQRAQDIIHCIENPQADLPGDLNQIETSDMAAFDENLRRSTTPLLEVISADRKLALEGRLYGNAYRGITDLVTKFVWPRPAKQVVHVCANTGITPNMVTSTGLLLVIAACYLFLHQHYALGLLAGWIMTFLDTVDGKLARVTVKSSKFGHLFDHGIDLFHPPFWYIFWGMSLINFQAVLGFDLQQMYWLIIIAYVLGRVVEGLFPLLGSCSIFTWRPYDAWFRLVTARRNPCLIILTLSVLAGRPDWGFIAVTFWSVVTTIMLIMRLGQATLVRLQKGPLSSWLSAPDVANGANAKAYGIFGATRGAYGRG